MADEKNAAAGRSSQVAGLPIGVLHLGVKTGAIMDAGFVTIEDVRNVGAAGLARIPMVGWSTVDELVRNCGALADATGESGTVDWEQYCAAIGVPLLPTGPAPETGSDFLRSLPPFLDAVAAQLPDTVFAAVLRERICQPPALQTTLDEIGARPSPPISRERVRQKERKLLGQLTGGLLGDDYAGLDIQFHPGFSRWWRIAADALAGIDDIEVAAFVDVLSEVWDVPDSEIVAQLPAILAIVTGEPQMTGAFRTAARINSRLFGVIGEGLRALPVTRLRLGRHAAALEDAGFAHAGDIISALQTGRIEDAGPTIARHASAHMDMIAACLTQAGEIEWARYREANDLTRVPPIAPATVAQFVDGLTDAVVALLRLHPVAKRAPDILLRRTSQDAGSRMTLQRVADELGTFPSTVKREETVLLAWLYESLIDHDFSRLRVWVDETWLDHWSQAGELYEEADDYANFADNLAWRWRMTGRDIRRAAPLLWAVLDGYPDNRRSGDRQPSQPIGAREPSGRIRLRGFRRLH